MITFDIAKEEDIEELIRLRIAYMKDDFGSVSEEDKEKLIAKLDKEMRAAAKELDFEKAAEIRDVIISLKGSGGK